MAIPDVDELLCMVITDVDELQLDGHMQMLMSFPAWSQQMSMSFSCMSITDVDEVQLHGHSRC